MNAREKMERKILSHWINVLFFCGLAGLQLILYSPGWWIWISDALWLLCAALHTQDAIRGYRILRNPLFYLVAIRHDLDHTT